MTSNDALKAKQQELRAASREFVQATVDEQAAALLAGQVGVVSDRHGHEYQSFLEIDEEISRVRARSFNAMPAWPTRDAARARSSMAELITQTTRELAIEAINELLFTDPRTAQNEEFLRDELQTYGLIQDETWDIETSGTLEFYTDAVEPYITSATRLTPSNARSLIVEFHDAIAQGIEMVRNSALFEAVSHLPDSEQRPIDVIELQKRAQNTLETAAVERDRASKTVYELYVNYRVVGLKPSEIAAARALLKACAVEAVHLTVSNANRQCAQGEVVAGQQLIAETGLNTPNTESLSTLTQSLKDKIVRLAADLGISPTQGEQYLTEFNDEVIEAVDAARKGALITGAIETISAGRPSGFQYARYDFELDKSYDIAHNQARTVLELFVDARQDANDLEDLTQMKTTLANSWRSSLPFLSDADDAEVVRIAEETLDLTHHVKSAAAAAKLASLSAEITTMQRELRRPNTMEIGF